MIAGEGAATRRTVTSIKMELVDPRGDPRPGRGLAIYAAAALAAGRRHQPIHAHIHTEKAMADLKIGVPKDGGRTIDVVLLDGEFGPLAAKEVTLFLSKPDAGIERLRLPAVHVEDTIWRVEGAQIPALGRWHVGVEILISDFEKTTIEDEVELPREDNRGASSFTVRWDCCAGIF